MTAPRVVDHQAHWYPKAILDEEAKGPSPRATSPGADGVYGFAVSPGGYAAPVPPSFYELDLQLESMDRNGIDAAVLSANLVSDVGGLEGGRAQFLVEVANHEIAQAQRDHPGRIWGLAMLPVEHPERALQTLDTAIRDEGLRGVCLLSNIAQGPIVSDEMAPVYARIAELGVPLFLHPANRAMVTGRGLLSVVEVGAGWMLDTAAAALTLVYSGLLDRHPDLTVIHPHFGGILPFIRGRVPLCEPPEIEHPLDWYLRNRFYVDTATDTSGTLDLTVETYGIDRILYATDWPWLTHEHAAEVTAGHDRPELVDRIKANRVPGLIPDEAA